MLSPKLHRYLFLFGALSLAFGMMIGAVPTSVPQLILLGNWLLEMNFRKKWNRVRGNKIFWVLSAVFLIHALGMFYTSNLKAGTNDLLIKTPLIFLPLVFFSAESLSVREFRGALCCFLIGSFANTAWCLVYSFVLHNNEVGRDASRFMSHIRLGLYLNLAIACSIYFSTILPGAMKKLLMGALAIYFLFAMYILGLASGLVNFFILSFFAVSVIVYKQKPFAKITSFLFLTISLGFILNYIFDIGRSQLHPNNTENNQPKRQSPSGRPYSHFDTKGQIENGNHVLINIQLDELKNEWQSMFPADSFNFHPAPHNLNRYEVLIRYLASKGLNKDSAGVSKLTDEDKTNIQKNICNYRYNEWSFMHKRIYELVCEYDDFINGRDVNGHSLTMRFYFWDAARQVIRKHPIFGVGTGDVQRELNKIYEQEHSPLEKEWYKRPHNQFLTILVALGIPGLLVFLISIFYPVIQLRKYLHVLYWPFFVLLSVSFILEDTLETQAGLTFYAVFNTLFLSVAYFDRLSATDGAIAKMKQTPVD